MNERLTTSSAAVPNSFGSADVAPGAARAQARRWRSAYHRRVLLADVCVLVITGTFTEWLGAVRHTRGFADTWHSTVFVALAGIVWFAALSYTRSRDLSLVSQQAEEYRRVAVATFATFFLAATADVFLSHPVSRLQFAGFAFGAVGLTLARFLLRADVRRRRKHGKYISRVVALGEPPAARTLSEYFARSPGAGYRLVGVCFPDAGERIGHHVDLPTGSIPVLGFNDDSEIEAALESAGADTLAVVYSGHLAPERVKFLAWRMQAINTEFIVVPGLTEVAAHRLQMRPLENLPLFVVEEPTHDTPSIVTKRVLDLVLGTIGLVVALPVIAMAGLAIKLDDRGPVFYRQQRVGMDGKPFKIIKLRSMYVDTDKTPQAEQHRHGSIFHKRTSDSCVTRVGKILRATSIDELPQLFNVLGGSMSVVGPRPLAVGEAGTDAAFIEHREHVKPGMTGLWQVSGRSDLEDKDRIRLDVSYAGNWSVVGDLVIIWRTVGAVLKRKGAY